MSCARWITCPPLYSVEAIEASVEASVEASIEVASRLSVEAASRRRGQGSARGQIGDNCHIWQLCPGHQGHRTRPRKVTLLLNPNTSTMAEELT